MCIYSQTSSAVPVAPQISPAYQNEAYPVGAIGLHCLETKIRNEYLLQVSSLSFVDSQHPTVPRDRGMS